MPVEELTDTPQAANPLSPSEPQALTRKKLLVGEGKEEVLFFNALLSHLNLVDVQVEQCAGKTNLRDYVVTLPKRPGFANLVSVGITRDADDDAGAAFQSVCTALDHAKLDQPQTSKTFAAGQPRVGVFILPDCHQSGMLEDLCLVSVAADLAMPCVDEFFRCIQVAGRVPSNMAKARVHAWLASQTRPDKRLGEAAQAGYWAWDNLAFDGLKQFLQGI